LNVVRREGVVETRSSSRLTRRGKTAIAIVDDQNPVLRDVAGRIGFEPVTEAGTVSAGNGTTPDDLRKQTE
jgi:hypothetical protein